MDKPNPKHQHFVGIEDSKNIQSDREILESIQPEYFQEEGFDPSLFELKVPFGNSNYCKLGTDYFD